MEMSAGVNWFTSFATDSDYYFVSSEIWEAQMTAFAKTLSRATGIDADLYSEQLKIIAMICGGVLFVLLLFATYGLDLSPGFF